MRTYTGRRVDPMNVQPEDIAIEDIAHSLARQCRFNGHCAGYLSVARHCVDVSWRLSNANAGTHGLVLARWGLLHDAAETYMGDLSRPMKHSGQFETFLAAEVTAERAVARAFNLPYPMPPEVKDADTASVLQELDVLWAHESTPAEDEHWFRRRFFDLFGYEVPA